MDKTKLIYERYTENYPQLGSMPIWEAYELLMAAFRADKKLLICGNGGSAADAEHIVGELAKGFVLPRSLCKEEVNTFRGYEDMARRLQKGVQAFALDAHASLMTAIGNDTGFDMVYAQQVYVYGRPGDVLLALSTSGSSVNIVNAVATARNRGLQIIGITGATDTTLCSMSDVCIRLPAEDTFRIQEYTMPTYHVLCAMVEETLFG